MTFEIEAAKLMNNFLVKLQKMYIYSQIITPRWLIDAKNYVYEKVTSIPTSSDSATFFFLVMITLTLIITLILNDKILCKYINIKNKRLESMARTIDDLKTHLELQNSSNLDLTKERARLDKELNTVKTDLANTKAVQEKLELELSNSMSRIMDLEHDQDLIHTQNLRTLRKKFTHDSSAKKDAVIKHIINIVNFLPARGFDNNSSRTKRMYSCIAKLASDFEIDMKDTEIRLDQFINYQLSPVQFTGYIAQTLNQQISRST